jgi:hypothetical protein
MTSLPEKGCIAGQLAENETGSLARGGHSIFLTERSVVP